MCQGAKMARRQIAEMKDREAEVGIGVSKEEKENCSALQFGPMCIRRECMCPLSFCDFQTFPTFRLVCALRSALCLSLLPLNSGRFPQLTLIDICVVVVVVCIYRQFFTLISFRILGGPPRRSRRRLQLKLINAQYFPALRPSLPQLVLPPPPAQSQLSKPVTI